MKKFSMLKKIYIALLFFGGTTFSVMTLFVGFHPALENVFGKGDLIAIGIIVAILFFTLAILEIISPNKKNNENLPTNRTDKKSVEQVLDDAINEENKKRS